MTKLSVNALILCFTSFCFSQQEQLTDTVAIPDVPFAIIEDVPVYPGCTGNTESLKQCMSDKIKTVLVANFNADLANSLKLKAGIHRINVQFKIDTIGMFVDVRAHAPHPALEEEAIRVIGLLPQIEPGKLRGKKVGVIYSLPIVFETEEDKTKQKKKRRNSRN